MMGWIQFTVYLHRPLPCVSSVCQCRLGLRTTFWPWPSLRRWSPSPGCLCPERLSTGTCRATESSTGPTCLMEVLTHTHAHQHHLQPIFTFGRLPDSPDLLWGWIFFSPAAWFHGTSTRGRCGIASQYCAVVNCRGSLLFTLMWCAFLSTIWTTTSVFESRRTFFAFSKNESSMKTTQATQHRLCSRALECIPSCASVIQPAARLSSH